MATQDEWHRVTVRLPPHVHEALKTLAVRDNRSINAQLVDVLDEWIRKRAALNELPPVNQGLRLADWEAAVYAAHPTDLERRLCDVIAALHVDKQAALLELLKKD